MGIKENWLKEDEKCPACGQVTKPSAGITKQNIKKLFSFDLKKGWLEIVLMFGMFVLAWAYQHDTSAYREFMANRVPYCTELLGNIENYGNELGTGNVNTASNKSFIDELQMGLIELNNISNNSFKWNTP